jgi:signal transduction histidine kinase
MYRTVRIDRRSWVQGFALRRDAFQSWLDQAVLSGSEIASYVTLDWSGEAAAGSFAFSHQFAAPFGDLQVVARLRPLPEEGPRAWSWIAALAALVALSIVAAALAAYRMIAASERLAAQRSDFVSAVTHELKSPLTTICMYSEMLEQGIVSEPEARSDYYRTIRAESERLGRLVSDVLEFSRLERGSLAPEGAPGTMAEVVDEVLRVLGPQARAQGFTIEVDLEEATRGLQVDRDALVHALMNLVDNALKFSAAADERRVIVSGRRVGGGVTELTVRDHGPGVPPELLRRVFEPFFRGERELVRRTKGTGIGLALVAGLAQRMGGRVEGRNHPDGGFEVSLRLLAPAAGG